MGISFNAAGAAAGEPAIESESGTVTSGDAAIVSATSLSAGDTFEVTEATLVLVDGQPVPAGLDLLIVSLDGTGGSTNEATILSGDGATQFVDETGNPLASFTFGGGADDVAGIFVDNGNFGGGTGSDQDVLTEVIGGIA